MIRRIFTFASVVSSLLCVAAAAMWVRSYWWWDIGSCSHLLRENDPYVFDTYAFFQVYIGGGRLLAYCVDDSRFHGEHVPQVHFSSVYMGHAYVVHEPGTDVLGFALSRDPVGGQPEIVIPLWAFPLAFAIAPGIWGVLAYRRFRPKGHCAACSYDLTGNTSGVCPECGTPVTVQAEVGA